MHARGERRSLAGRQGFEPRFAGPEPAVLPLNDLPAMSCAQGCAPRWAIDATRGQTPRSSSEFRANGGTINAEVHAVLPEVFECPQCERQFVFELVETSEDRSIYCPQCKRYLGEKDVNFVLITEDRKSTRLNSSH